MTADATGTGRLLHADDHALLQRLLRLSTAGPLETGDADTPVQLWQAQHAYARAAQRAARMRVVHHAPPDPAVLLRPDVPAAVRAAARDPAFLARQPSLVLRLGPELPTRATVMFNVHLDTVSGTEPVEFDGRRFTGRGAVDAKGPAVALLAGVRAAAAHPAIGRDTAVVIQAVAGEEGGAMGTFGTRPLIEAGHVGRLNVFCEPTGLRHIPRATASMTARLTVAGQDAIDDRPGSGHNATVLLGFLAQHLAAALRPGEAAPAPAPAGSVCIAGLHTGDAHNRVYGTGELLLNLSYATSAEGAAAEQFLDDTFATGLKEFTARFAGIDTFARTAADAAAVTRLQWDKRGLPCLSGADAWAEDLLAAAGVPRQPDGEPAFTCDAIWMHDVPGTFTTVLGPGSLERNHAHAPGEFVDLHDLEEFAAHVRRILLAFADQRKTA
jgi:acetylornithine deacetylase/succinyl-diaminopimelate desuccinylase-like protein